MRRTPRLAATALTNRTARFAFEPMEDRRLMSASLAGLLAHSTGTVTGRVFTANAVDNAGFVAGDTPLAGLMVYVDADAAAGRYVATDPTAVTAADGTYSIPGVLAGTAVVRVMDPDTAAIRVVPGPKSVTVAVGATVAGVDFGVDADQPAPVVASPLPTTGSIDGSAFSDLNASGRQDVGEPVLPSVTAYLDANGNGTLDAGEATTTTDADGHFSFADAPLADAADVRFVPPTGYVFTPPAGGSDYVGISSVDSTTPGGTATNVVAGYGPIALTPVADVPAASPFSVAVVSVAGPKTVLGGTSKTVRVKLTNTSASTVTGPVALSLYASADKVVAVSDDPFVGSATVPNLTLKPGQSRTVTAKIAYAQSLASGIFYTGVSAALTGATTPVSPATATSAAPVTVLQPQILPGISFVSTDPVKLKAGRRATVAVRVTNHGTVPDTVPYTVTLDATFTTGGDVPVPLAKVTRRLTLGPGQSAVIRVPFTALVRTPGTYSLFADVGVADAVQTGVSLSASAETTA